MPIFDDFLTIFMKKSDFPTGKGYFSGVGGHFPTRIEDFSKVPKNEVFPRGRVTFGVPDPVSRGEFGTF